MKDTLNAGLSLSSLSRLTPPYLRDGRAITLTEAILDHGGEGQASEQPVVALSTQEQQGSLHF